MIAAGVHLEYSIIHRYKSGRQKDAPSFFVFWFLSTQTLKLQ